MVAPIASRASIYRDDCEIARRPDAELRYRAAPVDVAASAAGRHIYEDRL